MVSIDVTACLSICEYELAVACAQYEQLHDICNPGQRKIGLKSIPVMLGTPMLAKLNLRTAGGMCRVHVAPHSAMKEVRWNIEHAACVSLFQLGNIHMSCLPQLVAEGLRS